MSLATATRQRIRTPIESEDVVLFMKGDRDTPPCGFSSTVVQILDQLIPHYKTVDVLADPEVREGIKEYASWPTIPQLYVRGEFVGGCDIIGETYAAHELHETLGVELAAADSPEVSISDTLLVAHCHHGQRSQIAAEHFASLGFTNAHNLLGGIEAWSLEIDDSVPRY
jgi:monothiol glutaredoxin